MSEVQIRFLVESYYDIQKLRIETFNRIVAYVKSNIDKFSQEGLVAQRRNASQKNFETQDIYASHRKIETQHKNADTSQGTCETHNITASQMKRETRSPSAVKVKPSKIAHEIVMGRREVPEEISELVWYFRSLHETEKQLAKRLDEWSSNHPIRVHFLNKIRGIGGILASGIIAYLSPISRFDNISKLWAFCGLAPHQKRRRGKKLDYNPRLKTLMWKIASSFEKQKPEKSRYRRMYDEKKNYLLKRPDLREPIEKGVRGAKLHVRYLTMRFVVKRFLADLWVQWRLLEGLPITKPYAHDILGHTEYIKWEPDKE